MLIKDIIYIFFYFLFFICANKGCAAIGGGGVTLAISLLWPIYVVLVFKNKFNLLSDIVNFYQFQRYHFLRLFRKPGWCRA